MSSSLGLAVAFAGIFAVPTLALLAGFAPVSRRRLDVFAQEGGVTVTPDNGRVLIGYLARVPRWRAVGGAAGWIAGGVFALPGASYFWGAAGYLVGALAAEIGASVRWAPTAGPRRAALDQRRSGDYLSWGARWGPLLVVAALACEIWGYRLWPGEGGPDLRPSTVILAVGGMAAVAVVMWSARRLIIGRARPVLPADLGAADDAIRSRSLQTISGASLALMCLAATNVMWAIQLDLDAPEPFNWILSWLTFGTLLSAVYAWFRVRVRVRRFSPRATT
ncbi:hypothetical protein Psi02_33850 [Planotetraspora silvatica]|uniref:Uncharacterized protein n=1 Tax=Planotetraspora silvatica TaxID=234614 RepID=A0A8J3UM58_9ACTN|nr:hypothetical protein [Planotetraspora silvatica]GII46961.1 hypothetical protein Psi02_33850 [Planotetraspora silvatica]